MRTEHGSRLPDQYKELVEFDPEVRADIGIEILTCVKALTTLHELAQKPSVQNESKLRKTINDLLDRLSSFGRMDNFSMQLTKNAQELKEEIQNHGIHINPTPWYSSMRTIGEQEVSHIESVDPYKSTRPYRGGNVGAATERRDHQGHFSRELLQGAIRGLKGSMQDVNRVVRRVGNILYASQEMNTYIKRIEKQTYMSAESQKNLDRIALFDHWVQRATENILEATINDDPLQYRKAWDDLRDFEKETRSLYNDAEELLEISSI